MAFVDSAKLGQHGIVVVRHCSELPKPTVSMILPRSGEAVVEKSRWQDGMRKSGFARDGGGGAQRYRQSCRWDVWETFSHRQLAAAINLKHCCPGWRACMSVGFGNGPDVPADARNLRARINEELSKLIKGSWVLFATGVTRTRSLLAQTLDNKATVLPAKESNIIRVNAR